MVSYIKVEIPDLYPYVLYVTGTLAFECFVFTFFLNSKRLETFNKEHMIQFNDKHNHEMKCDAAVGGFPDMGNGFYANKLTYRKWYDFQI